MAEDVGCHGDKIRTREGWQEGTAQDLGALWLGLGEERWHAVEVAKVTVEVGFTLFVRAIYSLDSGGAITRHNAW